MRILVTGSSGFVGAACRRVLVEKKLPLLTPPSTQFNLLDETCVRAYLEKHRPTHLLHAAWRPVHGDVLDSPENANWLQASLLLVRSFREAGGQRAACVGSSAEYDWSGGICRVGTTSLRPASVYGAAKNALRTAASAYAETVGLSLAWPRVFDAYGPGEHPSRLSTYVLRSLLAGQPAMLTDGRQVRDYLYIDDIAEGIVATLLSAHEGETDIASGVGLAVRDLAAEIARQVGREDLLRLGARPTSSHEQPIIIGDGVHALKHIGWRPRYSLEQGVAAMVSLERRND